MREQKSPIEIVVKKGEPWVELASGSDLSGWARNEQIQYNQMYRQAENVQFFRKTFDFLTDNGIAGDYFEFGCHRGRTFRMALSEARRQNRDAMHFLAFDSFQGLPPPVSNPSIDHWRQGALATSEEEFLGMIREHGIYTDRVQTIKGYYSDSLTPALADRLSKQGRSVALATVDCDLYESAVPVFAFLEHVIQDGSVVLVDDLFAGYKGNPTRGVARAFLEYQRTSRWRFVRYCDVGWWGRSYIAYTPEPGAPLPEPWPAY